MTGEQTVGRRGQEGPEPWAFCRGDFEVTCAVGSKQTTARRECLQEEGVFAAAGRTCETRTGHGLLTGFHNSRSPVAD